MNKLTNHLKKLSLVTLVFVMFLAFSLSSCGSKKQDNNEESATEQVEESTEHPAGDHEHPEGDGEEHHMDSSAHQNEHPSSDEGGGEHPN